MKTTIFSACVTVFRRPKFAQCIHTLNMHYAARPGFCETSSSKLQASKFVRLEKQQMIDDRLVTVSFHSPPRIPVRFRYVGFIVLSPFLQGLAGRGQSGMVFSMIMALLPAKMIPTFVHTHLSNEFRSRRRTWTTSHGVAVGAWVGECLLRLLPVPSEVAS